MKIAVNNQNMSVRMTDEQARQLIQRLQGMVERRAELIEAVPDLKNWSDHVMSAKVEDGGQTSQIQFYICAV